MPKRKDTPAEPTGPDDEGMGPTEDDLRAALEAAADSENGETD